MRDLLATLHAQMSPLRAGVQALLPATPGSPARIEASAEQATVWIYDAIGMGGVSAGELVPQLDAVKAEQITVRLNSPGGDYFDGVAIANALARHPAQVAVHVDGLAASAASVIAMAGDEVVMHPGAQMMIHDALTLTIGNAADHEKTRALLDSASEDIARLYASRAGGDAGAFRELMRAETWYTAEQAVTARLADSAPDVSRETSGLSASWRDALVAFHAARETADVSRETQTSSTALPTAEDAPPDPSSPGPATLSEQLCSAFREATK